MDYSAGFTRHKTTGAAGSPDGIGEFGTDEEARVGGVLVVGVVAWQL
jgi:hypothetical protein